MSEIIRILPDHVVHKISAGGIVQCPANIVKELLENALDAEAKCIHLIIQDAGKSLIKVIDDGRGMSFSDAKMSFFRYATSKIKTTDDLLKIKTLGFRGEALTSISAVCQVEMQTRRKEDDIGISLLIEGNKLKGEYFIQKTKGTSVTVKNIFYNVPARRKFLKSNNVELRKIMDEFNRLTIAYPKVRFILSQKINNKLKKYFDFPPVSLSNRIVGVLGKKINEEMISIDEHISGINLKGYIINPSHYKKSLREQFIFVNNRFIKSSYLYEIVLKAFNGFLSNSNHPSYFLFIFLDPTCINVNIHPTKNEIIFKDEYSIYTILYNSIQRVLGTKQISASLSILKLSANYNPLFNIDEGFNISTKKLYEQIQLSQSTNNIDLCKNVTVQLHKKYIISILHSELIIIDQYRAHKRIFYEYLLNYKNSTSQQLKFPISLFFSRIQLNLIKKIKNYLVYMGFSISFHEGRLIVEAAPVEMTKHQVNDFFNIYFMNIYKNRSSYLYLLEILASSISIKHGLSLSIKEMNHIIYELFCLCEESKYTPSGKKIFITLNNNIIIKKFNEL